MNEAHGAMDAHRQRLFQQWLNDANTIKFFRALEDKRIIHLTAAARNSTKTGVENAREHNRLVEANMLQTIIETYGPGSNYPYQEFDTRNTTTSPVIIRDEGVAG